MSTHLEAFPGDPDSLIESREPEPDPDPDSDPSFPAALASSNLIPLPVLPLVLSVRLSPSTLTDPILFSISEDCCIKLCGAGQLRERL